MTELTMQDLPGVTADTSVAPLDNVEQQRHLLDVSEVVERVGYYLKGMYYDPIQKKIVEQGRKIVNDEGYSTIMAILDFRLSRVFSTSVMGEEEIAARCRTLSKAIAEQLASIRQHIKLSIEDYKTLILLIDDACYATMTKSKGGKMLTLLQKSHRLVETRAFGSKGNQQSMKDMFK